MSIIDNIKTLCSLYGVTGSEHTAAAKISKMFQEYGLETQFDVLGNLIAVKKGKNSTHTVMLEAHMDEIGLMVSGIDKNGFLSFTNVGGIDTRILPASEVIVHGKKDILGIIGSKPSHLLKPEERNKNIDKNKMFIDIGFNKEEAQKLVSVGDVVSFHAPSKELLNGFIMAKSQDDRTSVAIILDVLSLLKNVILPFDLCVVVAVQEEVGCRGALVAATKINPSFAVVIDVSHGTTPDAQDNTYKSGSGTIITIGPNIHPVLSQNIIKKLNELEIKYSLDVEGGNTGTDAWAVQVSKEGIPTVLFSIPLKYMHTSGEVSNIKDAKSTSYAIASFLQSIEKVGDVL